MHWVSWERMCLDKKDGGLGFKDIEKFNKALLAKQGWRLLMDPDSLCARVVKSRYYPNGDFLSANIGSRPSYAWRSIVFGRELLVQGLRRNVGSGEAINVWMDKWLFDSKPIAPMRKQISFDLELRVCDLINLQTRTWDRGKLEEVFFPADVERVLKIKPAFGKEDSYEWVHNKWGAYSVKSGYWLACSLDRSVTRVNAMSKPSINDLRCKVWDVNTAPKIKIFLWKALSNALAVSSELITRGMKVDPRCQRCGEDNESINHVIFTCPVARRVWATSGFPFPPRGFEHRQLYENFDYLFACGKDKRVPRELFECFPWVLWLLWKNRNAFAFEGKEYEAEVTVAKCFEDAKRWFDVTTAVKAEEKERTRRNRGHLGWKAPDCDRIKCNVGVSLSKRSGLVGAAWIVRDCDGKTLVHSRRAFSGVSSIFEAKRLALIWALESMISHRMSRVTFEVESDVLVGAVNRPRAWPAYRADGEELRFIIGNRPNWKMESVKRDANKIGFLIVRSVTRDNRIQSYVAQGCPRWIEELIEDEASRSRMMF